MIEDERREMRKRLEELRAVKAAQDLKVNKLYSFTIIISPKYGKQLLAMQVSECGMNTYMSKTQ